MPNQGKRRMTKSTLFRPPPPLPKGPFRTKKTTAITEIVNCYAVVFLLRPPNLLRRGPFSDRESVCNLQENGVRTRCAAIVNHRAVLKILRVVNLLRVVFLVRRGPLGLREYPDEKPRTFGNPFPPNTVRVHTKGVARQNGVLRRVLRRFWEGFSEGF